METKLSQAIGLYNVNLGNEWFGLGKDMVTMKYIQTKKAALNTAFRELIVSV